MRILQVTAAVAAIMFFATGTAFFVSPGMLTRDFWFPPPTELDRICVRVRLQLALLGQHKQALPCSAIPPDIMMSYADHDIFAVKRPVKINDEAQIRNVTALSDGPPTGVHISGTVQDIYEIDLTSMIEARFRLNNKDYVTSIFNISVSCKNDFVDFITFRDKSANSDRDYCDS